MNKLISLGVFLLILSACSKPDVEIVLTKQKLSPVDDKHQYQY